MSSIKSLRDYTMDVQRAPQKVRVPRWLAVVALAVAGIAVLAFAFAHSNGGPSVDKTTIVTDTAVRGTFVRSIAATGALASENVRIVDAVQPGVVEAVYVKPGASVQAGEVVARLENPDLEAAVVSAQSQFSVAQAELGSAREQMQASALTQQSSLVAAQAQMEEDATSVSSLKVLNGKGYVADSTYRIAAIKNVQSRRQVELSRAQIGVDAADQQAKVAAAQAHVDEAAAQLRAKEQQLDALVIRTGAPGVVQTVDIDPGVRIEAGTEVAKVADVRTLKAVLQVPESQVHDVTVGMPVSVDTGNGSATGRVTRIAPSANNGSVSVDVNFERPLPPGARPYLNVNATIALESVRDAVSIARPAGANDNTAIDLYRIVPGTSRAQLTHVRLGRGSTDRVQVLSGISPGDVVIVSDMSPYAGQSSIALR